MESASAVAESSTEAPCQDVEVTCELDPGIVVVVAFVMHRYCALRVNLTVPPGSDFYSTPRRVNCNRYEHMYMSTLTFGSNYAMVPRTILSSFLKVSPI